MRLTSQRLKSVRSFRLSSSAVLRVVVALAVCLLGVAPAYADDPRPDDPLLESISTAMELIGVGVVFDGSGEGPSYGDRPRLAPLVGFSAWPDVGLDLERHSAWLDAFESGARGAMAAVPAGDAAGVHDVEEFRKIWRGSVEGERVVITFDAADRETAKQIGNVLAQEGYAVYLAIADPELEAVDPTHLGRMFAEAEHVLVLDTVSARLNPVIQFEAELLAELKRQRAWVASGDDELPPLKRGSMDVVESLGALPMKIVPGGIVLGVVPELPDDLAGARWSVEDTEYGIIVDGTHHPMEVVSTETREAIAAFVANAESHSVVDIAGDDIALAKAFADGNRIGRRMVRADHVPFESMSVRGAEKSLIVDDGVHLRRTRDGRVAMDVALQVRFYRRDEGGHADRLATLRFTLQDVADKARVVDVAWDRHPDHAIRFDGNGIDDLIDNLDGLALDAGLIAVARLGAPDPVSPEPDADEPDVIVGASE